MTFARSNLGETAFLRYRGDSPLGSLPPAYFESIAMAIYNSWKEIQNKTPESMRERITHLVQSDAFRAVTGPGANSRERLKTRIRLAEEALLSAS